MGMHQGKVAIITGGGQGIGQATAKVFASEGASVVVVDRNADTAGKVAAAITASGGSAIPVICDVRRSDEVDAATKAAVDAFGRIDILIQYAQIIKIETPLELASAQDFLDSWESGLMGTVNFMQSAFPQLKASGDGVIVNVGSAAGIVGTRGCAAYASAKEAIRGLTRVAANEWGRYGIRVNAICPFAMTPAMDIWRKDCPDDYQALVDTCPLGRVGDPEQDIASAVLAITSPNMRYMTGSTFMLDGGQQQL